MGDEMLVFWAMVGTLALVVYIMPMALAMHRKCKATAGIAIVNIFLGWTFLGWVIALAWAASGDVATPAQTPKSS